MSVPTPFEVPFHYDDPEGGGVVKVIATGRGGASLQFGVPPEVDATLKVKWGIRLMGKLRIKVEAVERK